MTVTWLIRVHVDGARYRSVLDAVFLGKGQSLESVKKCADRMAPIHAKLMREASSEHIPFWTLDACANPTYDANNKLLRMVWEENNDPLLTRISCQAHALHGNAKTMECFIQPLERPSVAHSKYNEARAAQGSQIVGACEDTHFICRYYWGKGLCARLSGARVAAKLNKVKKSKPRGLSDADWCFIMDMLEWISPDSHLVLEVVVEYLLEQHGVLPETIRHHLRKGKPLLGLVSKIEDDKIRLYCEDMLDPYLRFQMLVCMKIMMEEIRPALMWCEADVAENWTGGKWYELRQKINDSVNRLDELIASQESSQWGTGKNTPEEYFRDAISFAEHLQLTCSVCDEQIRGAVQMVRDHRWKSTRFIIDNPVLQLAAVMHPDSKQAAAAANEFFLEGLVAVVARAAAWYNLTIDEFVKAATDERYIGPASILAETNEFEKLISLRRPTRRVCDDATSVLQLLKTNFQHLPVGNAYAEYVVKLVKLSTSESRAFEGVMVRKLRARTASHVWYLNQLDFKMVRVLLSHNQRQRLKAPIEVHDASHLGDVLSKNPNASLRLIALRVADARGSQKKREYLVQWRGFHSDADMTWEAAAALSSCEGIMTRITPLAKR